jgi:amidase
VALRLGTRLSDSDRSKSVRRLRSIAAKIQKKLASLNAVLVLPGAGELPPIASEVTAAPPQGPARPARFADAAGLAGIGIPCGTISGAPVSVSLWGPAGTDESLWRLASADALPLSKVEYAAIS